MREEVGEKHGNGHSYENSLLFLNFLASARKADGAGVTASCLDTMTPFNKARSHP